MKHLKECNRVFAIYEFTVQYYKDWWPSYCKFCNGWGGHVSYYDPSPSGVSLGSGYMMETDLCPHCVEKNICPRCGKINSNWKDNIDAHCYYCGWEIDESKGLLEQPTCACHNYCELCGAWLEMDDADIICKKCKENPRSEKISEYMKAPVFCPFCDSENIGQESSGEFDAGIAFIDMVCDTCGKIWREEYNLVAISWRPMSEGERIYSDENYVF